MGPEDIMNNINADGSHSLPCQPYLRYGCDFETADRICCFSRDESEPCRYALEEPRTWLKVMQNSRGPVTHYDSVTGKPLFTAPRGRTIDQFIEEA